MKKAINFYSIIWAICLALFNIIVFVVPNPNKFGSNFWMGYILITITLVGNLVCAFIALKGDNLTKTFYNIPLIKISYTGIIASAIVGTVFMVVPFLPIWLGIVICFVILAFVAIAVLKAKAAADIVSDIDEKIKTKTAFIRLLTADAEHLMATAKTVEIKADAKKVYEAIRYSDPMSNDALTDIETKIQYLFNAFTNAVKNEDAELVASMSAELLDLIDARNKKCKVLK